MGLGDTVDKNNDQQEKKQPQPYVPLHVSVDMGDQSTGKAGASLSSRLSLGYVNEHGEIIRGFFTTNEYADPVKVFGSRFATAMANPLYKDLQPLYTALENYVAVNTPEAAADGLFGCFDFRYLKKFNDYEEEKRFNERVNSFSLRYPPDPKEKESVERFAQLLIGSGADAELVNRRKDSEAFLSFCRDILLAAHSAYRNRNTGINMGQSAGGNINKRNNAAYDYTAELKMGDLLCKSSSMSLTAGGRTLHGTFMVNARGVEISRIHPQYTDMGLRRVVITGSGLRSMNRLRIMDYMIANLDRHAGNLFYQLDKSGTGDIKLVGVQGIDNDASFGNAEYRGKGVNNRMSMLDDITIIDKEMADEILHKDYALIEARLRLAGLSADEMDMNRERFNALKTNIQKGRIRVIDGEDAWDEMARPENLAKLRYRDGSRGNLFDLVARNIDSINARTEEFRSGKVRYFPVDPPVSGQTALGISVSSDERMNLQSHLQELQRFSDAFAKNYPEGKQPEELKAVTKALGIAVDTLKGFTESFADEKKTALTDNERNLLRERLRAAESLSKAYLQKTDPPSRWGSNYELKRFGCNEAKNLNAYIGFAVESIDRDALEALNDKVRTQAAAIKKAAEAGTAPKFSEPVSASKPSEPVSAPKPAVPVSETKAAEPVSASKTRASGVKPAAGRTNAAGKTDKIPARPAPDKANMLAKTAAAVKSLTEIRSSLEDIAKDLSRGDLSADQRKEREDRFMSTGRQTVCRRLREAIRLSGEFPDDHPFQSELGKLMQSKALDTILFEGVTMITKKEGPVRNGGVFGALGLSPEDVQGLDSIAEKNRKILESRKTRTGADRKIRTEAGKTNSKNAEPSKSSKTAGQKTAPGFGKHR